MDMPVYENIWDGNHAWIRVPLNDFELVSQLKNCRSADTRIDYANETIYLDAATDGRAFIRTLRRVWRRLRRSSVTALPVDRDYQFDGPVSRISELPGVVALH